MKIYILVFNPSETRKQQVLYTLRVRNVSKSMIYGNIFNDSN